MVRRENGFVSSSTSMSIVWVVAVGFLCLVGIFFILGSVWFPAKDKSGSAREIKPVPVDTNGFTFEDIGTDANDIKVFALSCYKSSAKKYLIEMRGNPKSYFLDWFIRNIVYGDLSLEDLGTSVEELETLRVMSCKVDAQKYLKEMREDPEDKIFQWLQEAIKGGKYDPNNITKAIMLEKKEKEKERKVH